MRITFLLPGPASRPAGGIRVFYRLGSELAHLGHQVRLLHPVAWLGSPAEQRPAWRKRLSWIKHASLGTFRPRGWMPRDPRLDLRLITMVSPRSVGAGDAVVATGWRAMRLVADLPPRCGAQVAYVQGIDAWDGSLDDVLATLSLPMHKVAVAQWLAREVRNLGETCAVVPNGIDHDLFFVEAPPAGRRAPVLAMLGHEGPWKGTGVALAALDLVRRARPDIRCELFCAGPPQFSVPDWATVAVDPSPAHLRALYNRCQIFLAPSLSEGWDLAACEAMACGAALVASRIPAREEYARDGENALLVPPGDANAMAAAALLLLNDDTARVRLTNNAVEDVQRFTWERSGRLLEAVIREFVTSRGRSGRLDHWPDGGSEGGCDEPR